MNLEPLWVSNSLIIGTEFLSVSYTRNLTTYEDDGEIVTLDGVEAARRRASAVELRLDVKGCTTFDEAAKARIIGWKPLLSDRRGVVRVECGEFESRPKNLAARARAPRQRDPRRARDPHRSPPGGAQEARSRRPLQEFALKRPHLRRRSLGRLCAVRCVRLRARFGSLLASGAV